MITSKLKACKEILFWYEGKMNQVDHKMPRINLLYFILIFSILMYVTEVFE